VFIEWLYTNQINCSECDDREWGVPNTKLDAKHDLAFFGLWVFGDKIGSSQLLSDVLQAYGNCLRSNGFMVSSEGIKFVYANTTDPSPLREMLVNATSQRFYRYEVGQDVGFLAQRIAANEEFGIEAMRRISKHLGAGNDDCSIESCSIHCLYNRDDPSPGEEEQGQLLQMLGYDGDDGDYL
jgi:hypothetical protein